MAGRRGRRVYLSAMPNPQPQHIPPAVAAPSMLDLVRLSATPVFPPGGEELYRQIGRLTEMQPGQEVLDVGCGRGVSTLFLASTFGVEATGVDAAPHLVDEAEQRARAAEMEAHVVFQTAEPDDLPYRDGAFDVTVGEIGLSSAGDPARAVRELVRVTKPLGAVVLVQLAWTRDLDDRRRRTLHDHLGARPMMVVEWKQLLREAGAVELLVEDWSDEARGGRKPFHDFSEIFSLRERFDILRRAWRRWGWRGVRGAILREREVHHLLTRERVLALSLIKGTRWPGEEPSDGPSPAG